MLCAGDDLLLQSWAEITEIVAVSGHADNEISELAWILPGRPQSRRVYHIELDVVSVQIEVGAHKMHQTIESGAVLQNSGSEFLIEKSASGPHVVHLGN